MPGDDDLSGSARAGIADSFQTPIPLASGHADAAPPLEARCAPAGRSQIVFGPRGEIEMFLWTAERTRKVRISMASVPFSVLAMGDTRVKAALEHWAKSSPDQSWVTWRGIRSALVACAVDIDHLTKEYPPN